jgi:hypothetical protein
MVKISELKLIENAFFRQNLKYNKSSLYPFISKNFTEDKLFETDSLEKMDKLIEETAKDELAHNVLLNQDLQKLRKSITKKDLDFDSKFWISKLPEIKEKISEQLNLDFKIKNIVFCDSFPNEYKNLEQRGASTITVFEGNKNAGIYYLNKRVDNVSTAIHIIHEQIHTCLSQNKDKDQTFIEWFEEGIAIIYSMLIYYEITQDIETLNTYKTRSFIFSKVKPEWDFTKRYYEYMKIMSRIFLAGGFDLIQDLLKKYINKDIKAINEYLRRIQSNELLINYIPKNKLENFIATYFNILEPEQITPLEFVIVESLNKPKSINEISKEINASEDVTKNALGRLFGKGICIMVKDNKIDVIWRKKDLFDLDLIKPLFPLS